MNPRALAGLLLIAMPLAAQAASGAPEWFGGPLSAALQRARAESKQALLYFWLDGSQHCSDLWQQSLTSPVVQAQLMKKICYSVDAADPDGAKLVAGYRVTTLPTVLVVGADGRVQDAIIGFAPAPLLAAELLRIENGINTVGSLRRQAATSPDDLLLRFNLALKLDFVGQKPEAGALLDSIRSEDPDGRSVGGAELLLHEARTRALQTARNPSDLSTVDSAPVESLLPRLNHQSVRFKAREWLANAAKAVGDQERLRQLWREGYDDVPATRLVAWSVDVLSGLWTMRTQLDSSERRFAGKVARAMWPAGETTVSQAEATPLSEQPEDKGESRRYAARICAAYAGGLAVSGKPRGAVKTLERALALAPDQADLRAMLDAVRSAQR